jgi:hypothetical protein
MPVSDPISVVTALRAAGGIHLGVHQHVQNLQYGAHSQRQQPHLRVLRDRGHRDRDLLREHQRRRRRSCW